MRSRDAAGEIVQDTFLRVLSGMGRFRGKSTFATWLFVVTRSATAEWVRRERQRERVERGGRIFRLVRPDVAAESDHSPRYSHGQGLPELSGGDDTPGFDDDEDSRQAVREALADLPGAQRDALILCDIVGMSITEAAAVLGWGESRVKVTVFRARTKMRDLLKPYVSGERAEEAAAERAKEKR